MLYLLLVICVVGGCFATYPPFTNTVPQLAGLQLGSSFGPAIQSLPLTSSGTGAIGSIFPSTAPISFSDGDIGTSRIIPTRGTSSAFTNPIHLSTFRSGLHTPTSFNSPASVGSVGGVTMTPGSIDLSSINTFGSIFPSSSLNGGLIATSSTPASVVVPEVSNSFPNSRLLYVSPTITSVRYSIHSPIDMNMIHTSPLAVENPITSSFSFPLWGSASFYPSYLQEGNPSYMGSDGLSMDGYSSFPSVTSMTYPAYQSMTTFPYYSTYGQNIGTGYLGMQNGYPQYTNQGIGSFPLMNQGMGSFTSMNQGMGSFPSLNQGIGSFPSLNQGFGPIPSINAGIGGVSGYPNYPYMWNKKRYYPKTHKTRPY